MERACKSVSIHSGNQCITITFSVLHMANHFACVSRRTVSPNVNVHTSRFGNFVVSNFSAICCQLSTLSF